MRKKKITTEEKKQATANVEMLNAGLEMAMDLLKAVTRSLNFEVRYQHKGAWSSEANDKHPLNLATLDKLREECLSYVRFWDTELQAYKAELTLLPCPFCGQPEPHVITSGDEYYIECTDGCGAKAGTCETVPSAVGEWNRRNKRKPDQKRLLEGGK